MTNESDMAKVIDARADAVRVAYFGEVGTKWEHIGEASREKWRQAVRNVVERETALRAELAHVIALNDALAKRVEVDELDESVAYGWAYRALRSLEGSGAEAHRQQQAIDAVAAAVREAWAHRGRTTLDEFPYPMPPASPRNESATRLRELLPHLRIAAEMARVQVDGGTVELAIVATRKDGSGSVTAQFEFDTFLTDIEAILNGSSAVGIELPYDARDPDGDCAMARGATSHLPESYEIAKLLGYCAALVARRDAIAAWTNCFDAGEADDKLHDARVATEDAAREAMARIGDLAPEVVRTLQAERDALKSGIVSFVHGAMPRMPLSLTSAVHGLLALVKS